MAGGGKARDGGASRAALLFSREVLPHDSNYRVQYMG
jgi:hypothetical protein